MDKQSLRIIGIAALIITIVSILGYLMIFTPKKTDTTPKLMLAENKYSSDVSVASVISYDNSKCWSMSNGEYWYSGCKGSKMKTSDVGSCSSKSDVLTNEEIYSYQKWEASGKPVIEGCPEVEN